MAHLKIDLKSIAPKIAEKLDKIQEEVDKLQKLSRELYMELGYDLTVNVETEKSPTQDEA